MRKVVWTEDGEQLHKTHPGCMSTIFHALDYSNVKTILPHRKHVKRAKRNRRHKRISHDQDPFEVLELLDAETSEILVDESNKNTSSPQKKSLKARMKALVDLFKEDNHKEQGQDFIPSPRLQRNYAVHQLESNEWVHPIIFFPENENLTENPVSSKEPRNVMNSKINDSGDVLEIFKVNRELFVNILQDGSRVSNTKTKLTKSGSFPVAYKSGSRNLRPTKLKDKLNEYYAISRNEKRLDARAPKLASLNSGSLMTELDKKSGKNSDDDLNDNELIRIKRISSLNESADQYARLFDFSASKEATLQPSRSLKLTNGSEERSLFRRIHSLPHLDNPGFLRNSSRNERNPVDLPLHTEVTGLNSIEDCKCSNVMIDKSDIISENKTDVGMANSTGLGEDGFTIEEDDHEKAPEISTHSIRYQEEISQPEFQILEGVESLSNSEENLEKEIKNVNSNKRMESSMKPYQDDDDDFTYMKQILERSGFIKNGFQQQWYSSNQPLDPFVFQEIESQYFHDPDRFAEELKELSHRLLIFDSVDDVLVTIYERSSTYYPKALSSSCHIRPAPTGPLLVDEIWKRVSRLLDLKPDMNQSLDSVVSKDLGTDDGWMNLQMDSECVALDLEDLILDEILEEVLFECS